MVWFLMDPCTCLCCVTEISVFQIYADWSIELTRQKNVCKGITTVTDGAKYRPPAQQLAHVLSQTNNIADVRPLKPLALIESVDSLFSIYTHTVAIVMRGPALPSVFPPLYYIYAYASLSVRRMQFALIYFYFIDRQ